MPPCALCGSTFCTAPCNSTSTCTEHISMSPETMTVRVVVSKATGHLSLCLVHQTNDFWHRTFPTYTTCVQASQLSETLSTCRFAQRMMHVTVDAQKNKGGMSSVHGNLFKLDPVMQQYLEVSHSLAVSIACSGRVARAAIRKNCSSLCYGIQAFPDLACHRYIIGYMLGHLLQ